MEQALQIEELKLLHGDNWSTVYKSILAKERLETIFKEVPMPIIKIS